MGETESVAIANTILRGVVGSTVHGTALEGQDDRDEMGVFIEPPPYVCGWHISPWRMYRLTVSLREIATRGSLVCAGSRDAFATWRRHAGRNPT